MTRHRTIIRLCAVFAFVGMLSCGDGSTEPVPPPPQPDRPRATSLTVTPDAATLAALGDTVRLSARVLDQNGQVMAGAAVVWASSEAGVATVSSSGLVAAAGNGTATITATSGSASGSAAVTVEQTVSAVAVFPAADTLIAGGDTVRLAAEAADANGHAVAGAEFAWASSDTAVATADASGLVTGVAAGEAEIAATSSGVTGRAALTVVAQAPTTLTVTPDTVVLIALAHTARLSAEVRDQAGRVMEGAAVSWSSADPTVATVDAAGLVTAVAGGATMVSAMAGEVADTAVVTVMQSAGSVAVSPAEGTVAPGDTLRLAAEAFDENGNAIAGAEFSWSSSDASSATVDASGLVAGVAEGAATITAMAGSVRGTARITVANPGHPDRAALVALYAATDGPNWVNSENWLTDAPMEDWYGVETDASGSVIRLILGNNSLNGSIPAALADLRKLRRLWLGGSQLLTGRIPAELGNLPDLESLELGWSGLSGPIPPELGDLVSLRRLYLENNEFNGRIPPALGKLANLTVLSLGSGPDGFGGNDLTGPIPKELGNLTNLRSLRLGVNDLTGPIPPELGRLVELEELSLGGNGLSGSIPPELGNLSNLRDLALHRNDLTGEIPPELGRLASLTFLSLGGNSLDGSLPPNLGKLANLEEMYLWGNNLSGPIPNSFLQLRELRVFSIVYTQLCTPGTAAFVEWLRDRQLDGEWCNAADVAALTSLHEATGGAAWAHAGGWLESEALENWYGVTADSIGRLTALDLTSNGLAGQLPSQIGELPRMRELRLGGNPLTGRLPLSLARLPLRALHYEGTQLCAPAESGFPDWLNTIASHQGTGVECAPVSDRDVLEALYAATGGPNWTNNENWLTDAPLNEWYGVETDGSGRVTGLQLMHNALAGPIPPELVNAQLTKLGLRGNELVGPIPKELGGLASLDTLDLYGNRFSGSIPPELGDLASLKFLDLASNELVGSIPPELGGLASLERLHLYSNRFFGPIPPELGDLANLRYLDLNASGLSGPIPPELGNLTQLSFLELGDNELAGPIPPELGGLASLRTLYLYRSELTGPIPPEIGSLASLAFLALHGNELAGPIPKELGGLAKLEELLLAGNDLSGPIPPELGQLSRLRELDLGSNELTGPLRPEFGGLSVLSRLRLGANDLSGPIPPELGQLSRLRELDLSNNMAVAGVLAEELTALSRIETILAGGTGLCAPKTPIFDVWLAGIGERYIARCVDVASADAYLTQAVQSPEFPVPLVAGDRALLRVFPTAVRATGAGIPDVRARLYREGQETHVVNIPGTSAPIPTEVTEGKLSASANAEVPGEVIRPGLAMVIEVDPEGTLDPGLGVARRIPETGRLAVEVRAMPLFDLTLIPFVWSETRDSSIVDLVRVMTADPENHDMLAVTRTLLPVGNLAVTAHPPVVSSSNSAFDLLGQTEAIRVIEGGNGHYKGMMNPPVTGAGGVAYAPGRSSFSQPSSRIIAHELGHNFSLGHAPCGRPGGVDPRFPYPDGTAGSWGFDFREDRLVRPATPDLMSYCGPPDGISAYHFTKALRFRIVDEGAGATAAATTRSLLVWGGVDADSVLFLQPAFVVDAAPVLPDSDGDHQLIGWAADGSELFSLSFTMPEVPDGEGARSFVFALPTQPGWEALARLSLSGPDGSVTLDGDDDLSMAILRDPATGRVRGILRDLPSAILARSDLAAALSPEPGLEALFSRGIPDGAAWRR